MKVYIDSGHRNNEYDFGAAAYGYKESAIALSVAKKVQKLLTDKGVVVKMSRNSENDIVNLSSRPKSVKAFGADLFLCIHINAAENTSASGVEVLYKSQKGLATDLSNEISKAVQARNRGAKERTDLCVLNGFNVSVLCELGFITNKAECDKLITDSYQNTIANAIVGVIAKRFNLVSIDQDLKAAINKIVASGVNINAASWIEPSKMKLQYLDGLLKKLGGLDHLIKLGVIGQEDIWRSGKVTADNVRSLLIKYAEAL